MTIDQSDLKSDTGNKIIIDVDSTAKKVHVDARLDTPATVGLILAILIVAAVLWTRIKPKGRPRRRSSGPSDAGGAAPSGNP